MIELLFTVHKNMSVLSRKLPINRAKSRLCRIITTLLPRSCSSVVEVEMKDGSKLVLDARSRTEAGSIWNGVHEPDELAFLKSCLQRGDIVFDIGANVGMIAVPLARHLAVLGGGQLVAFEPVKSNFERLSSTLLLNELGSVAQPINCALGDQNGVIQIGMEKGGKTGNAILFPGFRGCQKDFEVTEVPILTIDSLWRDKKIPGAHLIKMDVEGSELQVLNGAREFLSANRPLIYGEFNRVLMPRFGHDFIDVMKLMSPLNYRVFAFEGPLKLVEVKRFEPGRGNVVLIPEEKVDNVLRRVHGPASV